MDKLLNFSLRYQIIFIIIFGFIVFSNIFNNGFTLDDNELIVNNPVVIKHDIDRIFLGGTNYRGDALNREGQFYRPVMLFFFMLTHFLFGLNLFIFHFWSVFFHIVNTILVLLLFKKLIKGNLPFLLSILFLVHPINAEAVNAISSLNDLLFVSFGLIAVHLSLFLGRISRVFRFVCLTILLILSLLSKETGVLFCFIVFISYFFNEKKYKSALYSPVLAFLLYVLSRVATVGLGVSEKGVTPIMRSSLDERLLSIPKITYFYLKTAFFPLDLSRAHHWVVKSANFYDFVLPLIVILLFLTGIFIIWLQVKKQRSHKWFLFFLLWFLIGVALHAQIIPLEYTVAERWFYFPLIGLIGMLCVFLESLVIKRTKIIFIAFIILVLIFSIRTYARGFDWKNNFTLTSHDIKINKDSFELELFYGTALLQQKKYKEALPYIENSVELNPYWLNINNLATAYLALGDTKKALELFKTSAYKYHYYKSFENLASIYYLNGDMKEAKKALDDGLTLFPNNPKLWYISYLYWKKEKNIEQANNSAKHYLFLKKAND